MARLDGKVAVVTGGANGMGLACCQRFAEEGARIVIGDVLDADGSEAVSQITEAGGEAIFAHLDAANARDNGLLMQAAVDRFGALDILVTAAGITYAGYRSGSRDPKAERRIAPVHESYDTPAAVVDPAERFITFPSEDWNEVLAVNLSGTRFAITEAARRMRELDRPGSIVTISATAATNPAYGSLSYGVSKAGVWMLTQKAALALAHIGIRVNSIGPGVIETNMSVQLKEKPDLLAALIERTPMGRVGTPREVANAALFLASEESSFFTGKLFNPDGGIYTG